MNYFQPYPFSEDQSVLTAWESQVVEAAETPWLAEALAQCGTELFPRFATSYKQLRALPRSARRALQRQLAHSRELTLILQEWLHQRAGRELQHKLARTLAGAALLLALGQGVGQAATITVNTTKPGILADGKCSLIEAIINANNDAATHPDCPPGSGADTIVLPKGTHTLTDVYTNYYGYTGLPVITSQITIEGNGAKITRKKSAPEFRLIAVTSSGDLTLQNLTLSGGEAHFDGIDIRSGFGGGIYNHFGTLTIENSTISGNRATGTGGYFDFSRGGGIYNHFGTLTIENSTISGNRATATGGYFGLSCGGGIDNRYGTLTINNSTISGNKAGDVRHGGIGGGMNNLGTLMITSSTVSKNTSGEAGGGVGNSGGTLIIINSTISGNKGQGGEGSGGGVINQLDGTATITNSTISGNKAVLGGGVTNYSRLTLNRSLISGNKADIGPEIGNSRTYYSYGYVIADNFNLFGTNGNAGVRGFTPGLTDIVPGSGVKLGRLRNNGGPTKTHALARGSPALDAIPLSGPGCTGTDQRGVARPQGAGCDIGAFERDSP